MSSVIKKLEVAVNEQYEVVKALRDQTKIEGDKLYELQQSLAALKRQERDKRRKNKPLSDTQKYLLVEMAYCDLSRWGILIMRFNNARYHFRGRILNVLTITRLVERKLIAKCEGPKEHIFDPRPYGLTGDGYKVARETAMEMCAAHGYGHVLAGLPRIDFSESEVLTNGSK